MVEYQLFWLEAANGLTARKDFTPIRAIVTVIGEDQVGIIASVCSLLAGEDVNVLNISQSVLQECFVMVMLVDLSGCQTPIVELSGRLDKAGQERGLSIRIQREDIFNAMHRI